MDKRATGKDVAKLAGVTQATVSMVLNNPKGVSISEATRGKVLNAARRLNYHINRRARGLRSNKAEAIGLFAMVDMKRYEFPRLLSGLQTACSARGASIVICSGNKEGDGEPDYIKFFHEGRIGSSRCATRTAHWALTQGHKAHSPCFGPLHATPTLPNCAPRRPRSANASTPCVSNGNQRSATRPPSAPSTSQKSRTPSI